MPGDRVVVMIASPLEAELVRPLSRLDDRLEIRYEPELLPPTRYPGDHRGLPTFRREPTDESRFQEMLERAEVLFGIPGDTPDGLAGAVRGGCRLRWIQATAAGAGEQVEAAALSADELDRVMITSASGVHAGPLAEFALFGLLALTKGLPRLLADQRAHRWDHYPVAELSGRTMLIVGLGSIGAEVARLAKAFGMRVVAVNRTGKTDSPDVDAIHTRSALPDLLSAAHAVVLTLPLTEETKGMIDAGAVARMPAGAIIVNVGRGGVLDEPALVDALTDGRLGGAVLDVFATEPLPPDSALWNLPNVLLSPHTAALSCHENERIVALFSENLRRYLAGEDLISRVHPTVLY